MEFFQRHGIDWDQDHGEAPKVCDLQPPPPMTNKTKRNIKNNLKF